MTVPDHLRIELEEATREARKAQRQLVEAQRVALEAKRRCDDAVRAVLLAGRKPSGLQ